MTFTAEDTLGQVSTQAFDALSQTGRQTANVVSFGPDLTLPLGTRNRVTGELRYSISNFGQANIDSDIYNGQVAFTHLLSELSNIGAVVDYERVDYKEQVYPRADKDTAYLRFRGQTSRTYLVLEGGIETVKVEAAKVKTTAPHASVAVQRRITPRLTLSAQYDHGYSNAAESLQTGVRQGLNLPGTPTGNVNVEAVAEPFSVDRGDVMLFRGTTRGSAALRITWERERYTQNFLSDRTVHGADLLFDRKLSPLWTLAALARWSHEQFINTEEHDNSLRFSVGLTRVLSRSMQIAAVAERTRSTGATTIDQFAETGYRWSSPTPRRAPACRFSIPSGHSGITTVPCAPNSRPAPIPDFNVPEDAP